MDIFFLGIVKDIKDAIIRAVEDVLRKFSFWICRMIYPMISEFYDIFEIIAKHRFFTDEDIQKISNNIYILVSVIMIFALAIKFLNSIVNPDVLTDKKKGATGILLRSFIGVLLIVLIPWAFQFAYKVQNIVLEKAIVQKLVFGKSSNTSGGAIIGGQTLSTFVSPTEGYADQMNSIADSKVDEWDDDHSLDFSNTGDLFGNPYSSCSKYTVADAKKMAEEVSGYGFVLEAGTTIFSQDIYSYLASADQELLTCSLHYYDKLNDDSSSIIDALGMDPTTCIKAYDYMIANNDPDVMAGCITNRDDNEKYVFNYNGVLGPIAGLFMAYEMLLLCIDIALRTIKLGLLELIAPIIICGYIYSGEILKRWVKEVVATYVLVFVKVGVVSFLVYGLSLMNNFLGSSDDFAGHRGWIRLFVIIGLLQLVKQLPQLINTIFGTNIKDAGGLKGRLGEMAGVGKLAQDGLNKLSQKAKGLGKTLAVAPVAAAASQLSKKFNNLSQKDSKAGHIASAIKRAANGKTGSVIKTLHAGINSNGKNTTKALKEAWDKSSLGMRNLAAKKEERRQAFNKKNHMDIGGTRTKYGTQTPGVTSSFVDSTGVERTLDAEGRVIDNHGNAINLNNNYKKDQIKVADGFGKMVGLDDIKNMKKHEGESDADFEKRKNDLIKKLEQARIDGAALHAESRVVNLTLDLEAQDDYDNSSIHIDEQKRLNDYQGNQVRKAQVQELDSTMKSFIEGLRSQMGVYEQGSEEQRLLSEFLSRAEKPGFINKPIEQQIAEVTSLAESIKLNSVVFDDSKKKLEKVDELKDKVKMDSYDSTSLNSEIKELDAKMKEYTDHIEQAKNNKSMSQEALDEITYKKNAIDVKSIELAKAIEDYGYITSTSGIESLKIKESELKTETETEAPVVGAPVVPTEGAPVSPEKIEPFEELDDTAFDDFVKKAEEFKKDDKKEGE